MGLPATIAEAAQRLRGGSLTATALTRGYFERIEAINPKLNAFITLTEIQAFTAADRLDAELRAGTDRGPLHGIPIVMKDLYDTAGIRTTVGSEFFKDRIPSEDATVVSKLSDAGAILLGKTNMNEFAAGISGQNTYFGDVHNPWDVTRSPGGSSSGTGAAIAAGLCLAGTGSDTGGSIRVPAAWDNLVGIRPTYGLVSLHGAYPRAYSLDVTGPLARSVADVAFMLSAMAGYDPKDPHSLNVAKADYHRNLHDGVRGLKLGIIENYTFRDVDPDVAAAVRAASDVFTRLGAQIVTVKIPLLGGPLDYSSLLNILIYEFHQILGDRYRATADKSVFGPVVHANIERAEKMSKAAYDKAIADRPAQSAQIKAVFASVDALLTPTMPTVAPPLNTGQDEYDRGRQFTLPYSFVGLPSISVPCGFGTDAMPIGLQIAANDLQEALLFRIARAYESATDWHKRRPPLACASD